MRFLSILHEGTLTGAPLAGLRVARILSTFGTSDIWVNGRITEAFGSHATQVMGRAPLSGPIRLKEYDLFFCHSAASAPIVSRLIEENARVTWWIHEDSLFFDVLAPRLINRCLNGATALVFVSSYCAFQAFSYWTWKRNARLVFVIPNFVPDALVESYRGSTSSPTTRKQFRFIHVGTLGHFKGTDLVIAAAKNAYQMGLPADFLLVGRILDGSMFESLPPNVRATGEISADSTAQLMANADFLLHPSRLDNQPLVVLEAIAGGLHVLCTPMPSLAEFLSGHDRFHSLGEGRRIDIAELIGILKATKPESTTPFLPYQLSERAIKKRIEELIKSIPV